MNWFFHSTKLLRALWACSCLRIVLILLAWIGLFPVGAYAVEAYYRDYELSDQTTLSVPVPAAWKELTRAPEGTDSLYIHYFFGDEGKYAFYMTVIPQRKREEKLLEPEKIREALEKLKTVLLKAAEETDANLEEIKGREVVGYCFTLTDRTVEPGKRRCVTQGMIASGQVTIIFSFSSVTNNLAERKVILNILANVRIRPSQLKVKPAPVEANTIALNTVLKVFQQTSSQADELLWASSVTCGPLLTSKLKNQILFDQNKIKRVIGLVQMAARVPSWGLSPLDPKEYQDDKSLRDILSEMKGMPVLNIGFQDEGRKQLIDFLLAKFVQNPQCRTRLPNAEELLYEWVLVPFDLEEPIVILECAQMRLLFNINPEGKIWWLDEIPANLGVTEALKDTM